MAKSYISTESMTHEQWLQGRIAYLGASEVAAAMGLNDYRSPYDVFLQKTGQEEIDQTHTPQSESGLRLEDTVADWWAEKNGMKVRRDNKIRIHPRLDFFRCNLDRVVVGTGDRGPGVCEIKTTSRSNFETWQDGEGKSWMNYYIQVQAQLAITGYQWAVVVCLVADRFTGFNPPETIPIERDEEMISMIETFVEAFWSDYVLPQIPPPAVSDEDVKRLYPKGESEKVLSVDGDTLEVIKSAYLFDQKAKDFKKQADDEKRKVKLLMQDYSQINYQDEKVVTFKNDKDKQVFKDDQLEELYPDIAKECSQTVTVIDEEAVKEKYPKIYEECCVPIPGSRRFLFNKKFNWNV